jgi:hypothetical protein
MQRPAQNEKIRAMAHALAHKRANGEPCRSAIMNRIFSRLRASEGANLGTIPVGSAPSGIAFDGVSIWVTNSIDGTVNKL